MKQKADNRAFIPYRAAVLFLAVWMGSAPVLSHAESGRNAKDISAAQTDPGNSGENPETDTDEDLDALNEQLDAAEEIRDRLREEAGDLDETGDALAAALSAKADEIRSSEEELTKATEDIAALHAQLTEAQEKEQQRRADMAGRVKHVYERGSSSWLVMLLTSGSFAEFLNRVEYLSQMAAYDQQLIDEYRSVQEELARAEERLTQRQAELEDTRSRLDADRQQLEGMLAEADSALQAKYGELSGAEAAVAELEAQIQAFERANESQAAANAQSQLDLLKSMAEAAGITEDPLPAPVPAPDPEPVPAAEPEPAPVQDPSAPSVDADGAADPDGNGSGDGAGTDNSGSDAADGTAEEPAVTPDPTPAAPSEPATPSEPEPVEPALPKWMQLAANARIGSYTVAAMAYTEEELNEMAAIIYCEARGEPYNGKVAVASVILNRVRSPYFGQNDIISVIRAPKQFEPVTTGHYDQILAWALEGKFENDRYYQECRQAALDALNGARTTNLCFFWAVWLANRYDLPGLDIGGHRFFGWVTQDW